MDWATDPRQEVLRVEVGEDTWVLYNRYNGNRQEYACLHNGEYRHGGFSSSLPSLLRYVADLEEKVPQSAEGET